METTLFISLLAALAVVIIGLLLVIHHLSRRHKAGKTGNVVLAADLRDEKIRSNIILTSIDDAVILIDMTGVIRMFNPAAATLTGWSIEDAMNIDWRSVVKLIDDKGVPYEENRNPFIRVLTSETSLRDNEALLMSRSGKQLPVTIGVTPLRNKDQKIYGAVAIMRDVTHERKAERQRSEFISTASHEMRTPVAAIEGYLSLAMNDKVCSIDDKARQYLDKAHLATEHLGQLFQDLLNSAKAEDGRLSSRPVALELGEFMEQLSNDLKFVADKKGLLMEFVIGSNSQIDATADGRNVVRPYYYVTADPDRLREVVTNLFDNAVKYTDKGKVSLGITGDENIVQIYVRDTGAGIPADDIPHLFQKFYRVDNSATRTIGGTGLGLYIARKMIELYQGRIWVESTAGKGSTFFINLPRLSTTEAMRAQDAQSAAITT